MIACDGVNSAVRRQFYPDEELRFAGINTWRGVTRAKPILTGRSYVRVGSMPRGKIVIYPIIDDVDGEGNQLINWTTEVAQPGYDRNDWNKPGRLEDFLHIYASWRFDWLDVADLIRRSEIIFEYPMVDKDPVDRWTFGRVTLAGRRRAPDVSARLERRGAGHDRRARARRPPGRGRRPAGRPRGLRGRALGPTAKVVRTNREHPPDYINIRVEELVGDRPFDNLDHYITQAELRALSDNYKRVAGFALEDVA